MHRDASGGSLCSQSLENVLRSVRVKPAFIRRLAFKPIPDCVKRFSRASSSG